MKQKCMILQKSVIAFRGVLLYDICMKRNADSPINRRCISPLSARLSSCRRDFFCKQKTGSTCTRCCLLFPIFNLLRLQT